MDNLIKIKLPSLTESDKRHGWDFNFRFIYELAEIALAEKGEDLTMEEVNAVLFVLKKLSEEQDK